ncbi:uncharacterized protein BDV14DRAFT_204937 [Aspergillus stella-maris]|uniref:uncharacterized protein n=1 Tax=Aspergillus stella-maris TaxID=1810926 RepID=UPI003CCCC8EB
MANSTSTHPNHRHFQSSDGVIILVLGALIFVTFALGLVSQLCDRSIPLFSYFFRPRKQYYEFTPEYTDADNHNNNSNNSDTDSTYGLALDTSSGSNHKMADLESGLVHASPIPSLPPSSSGSMRGSSISGPRPSLGLPRRSTTRYGDLKQHVLDVNGVRKMVLVVGGDDEQARAGSGSNAGGSGEDHRTQEGQDELDQGTDEYSAWYSRWTRFQGALRMQRQLEQHQRHQENNHSEEGEGGNTPLLGPWD